jgi:hypothetical protein
MVVTRLTLQRQVLAVQAHATSATFVMTAIAIRYQYNSSRTHSNQPSEETLPDTEETPSLKANDYDKQASLSVTLLYNVPIILYITLPDIIEMICSQIHPVHIAISLARRHCPTPKRRRH